MNIDLIDRDLGSYHLYHEACGALMGHYDEPLHGVIRASAMTFPDGTHPKAYTPFTCWHCGKPLTTLHIRAEEVPLLTYDPNTETGE